MSIVEYLGLIIPLVCLPIIANKVTVDSFAVILLITTLLQFYNQLVDYSFSYHGARMNNEEFNAEYNGIQSARLFVLVVFTCAILCFILLSSVFSNSIYAFFCIALAGFGFYFAKSWVYSYRKKVQVFALYTFTTKLIFLTLCIFFLNESNVEFFLVLNSLSIFIIYSLAGCYADAKVSFKLKAIEGISQLKSNYPLFITDFLPQLYITIPLIVFKGIWSSSVYASVNLAFRIYNAGSMVQWTLLKTFLPENKIFINENFQRLIKISIAISIFEFVCCAILLYYLIPFFFGSNLIDAYYMVLLLSVSYLFASVYICYGHAFHVLNRIENKLKNISFQNSLIATICVWPVSYYYEAWGYIFVVVLARFFLALRCYNSYRISFQ
ncbi:MAG: hypothetical protein KKH44_05640 [Bacteroidetes bacterium]|nr:hypothetical protein [Bacteroidota bacterium]